MVWCLGIRVSDLIWHLFDNFFRGINYFTESKITHVRSKLEKSVTKKPKSRKKLLHPEQIKNKIFTVELFKLRIKFFLWCYDFIIECPYITVLLLPDTQRLSDMIIIINVLIIIDSMPIIIAIQNKSATAGIIVCSSRHIDACEFNRCNSPSDGTLNRGLFWLHMHSIWSELNDPGIIILS